MNFIEGDDALDARGYALDTLIARIDARLKQQPYLAQFQKWGGVDLTKDDNKALELVKSLSKRPFLFLEIDSHETRDRKQLGTRHEFEISLEIIASDAAAPTVALLRPAIMTIVNDDYFYWRDAALQAVQIMAGQTKNGRPNRINPHTISCMVDTTPIS